MGAGHHIPRLALGLQAQRQDHKEDKRPDDGKKDKTGNRTQSDFPYAKRLMLRYADVAYDKGLDLFQLDQTAIEVLGVQEQHRLAMRADLGFTLAQNACALG